jgi:hypothetical protein
MSHFRQHTFAPSEMSKDDAITKLKKGTEVRHTDGRQREVILPPDENKTTGQFGVEGDNKNTRNQKPKNWTIVTKATIVEPETIVKPETKEDLSQKPPVRASNTMTKKHLSRLQELAAKHEDEMNTFVNVLEKLVNRTAMQRQAIQVLTIRQNNERNALEQVLNNETNAREALLSLHRQQTDNLENENRKKMEELKQQQKVELEEFETALQ